MNYGYDARKKMRYITKELRSELLKKKLKPLNWKTIEKIRKLTKKPLILKGILSYKDAIIAESSGVDAIWISNHGGRSSETDLTALEVLPEIRSKLKKKKTQIICDGGIRTGSDFLKTMSLGADFIGVGRPVVYALIANKSIGLQNYFDLMQDEIKTSFTLGGIDKINQIRKLNLKTHF
jgi:isopentenyl diphosphate isomerase/L-lactate dehydrogenase-like FMN-dependent dehydrogenase